MSPYTPVGPCVHCGRDESLACPVTGHPHERLVAQGDPPQGGTQVPRDMLPGGNSPGGALEEHTSEQKGTDT